MSRALRGREEGAVCRQTVCLESFRQAGEHVFQEAQAELLPRDKFSF